MVVLLPVRLELLCAVAVELSLPGALLDLPLLLHLLLTGQSCTSSIISRRPRRQLVRSTLRRAPPPFR